MTLRRFVCSVTVLAAGFVCAAMNGADNQLLGQDEHASASVPVGDQLRRLIEADWIERDVWFAPGTDRAATAKKPESRGVTTVEDAAGGCDGIKNGRCGFHTASRELDPWWQVDLGRARRLDRIIIYNRTDGKTAPRTRHIQVLVAIDAEKPAFQLVYQHNGETFFGVNKGKPLVVDLSSRDVLARIVRLKVPGHCSFALDEVEVYPADNPQTNVALGQPADQKSVSPYSKPSPTVQTRGIPKLPQIPEARFRLVHTREVILRARKLADRLVPQADAPRLSVLVAQLDNLEQRLASLETRGEVSEGVRRRIYLEARWLARRIAFCNPLLDFNKILFIKRHDPGGLYHMVHQYYGFGARPGGGLFILSDPFSDHPKLTNVLADSRVANGRLKGQPLTPGSFLSPELSYDSHTILFAYTQALANGIEWSPRASYHVFKVNTDGSRLVQLTDGPWNEFDPCFLPNGRIVFISERRGGYLRCGGSAPPYDSPTYTLHSMAEDGSDIVCLSFHETQEWHPSVTNDGMIVFTRWDYIDRDTNVAHHPWTCYPDGRDPRALHGNYPTRRESRPWMEMSVRAIPNSNKLVATAAAHHGHAFGSLVLIDLNIPDDGALSQITRLTPDVPFPEAEGGKALIRQRMVYATAWPLSEDDYLCAYDRGAKNHGIYWIDRYGNRELLYRDPHIPCLSPIPVRPRPRPPVIPDQAAEDGGPIVSTERNGCSATVAVVSVYNSDFEWPEGTTITALRIIQVLPKSTPPSNQPRIGIGNQTNARAVLGTVPVESDGSVYFAAPVGKLIYFQALDERGLAVQSMRSGTYLHPNERLTCQGCHESKHDAPVPFEHVPLAFQRPPSTIQPDVDGSNPFSFVRLVQPVLDRHCVTCHEQKKTLDLSRAVTGEYGWTRSYSNLAAKYGFYYHVNNGSINSGIHGGSRTIPGRFGARVSKLLSYLDEHHYGVKLSSEDFHRITLWLDCNSEFYGAYEKTMAQSRGEAVRPSLE